MRIWLSRNSEIPLREQLVVQVRLAIISGDLKPNEKLPGSREVGRRFGVHANTINAAFRSLASQGWLEFRKGSGFFVRSLSGDLRFEGEVELDGLISSFLRNARVKGYSLAEINAHLKKWTQIQRPNRVLVLEQDPDLRAILMAEISEATGTDTLGLGTSKKLDQKEWTGTIPVGLYGRSEKALKEIPRYVETVLLRSRSVQDELLKVDDLPSEATVIVISGWPDFLRLAKTMLLAAHVDRAALRFRTTREPGWKTGLNRFNTFVVTDSVVRKQLPAGCKALVFRVIAATSLDELDKLVIVNRGPGPH